MTYISEESKVIYQLKYSNEEKTFAALEWQAVMYSNFPYKGEQMFRYYGYYSNVARGKRKILERYELIQSILESHNSLKETRKNRDRLI
jgi:hypothetical protein